MVSNTLYLTDRLQEARRFILVLNREVLCVCEFHEIRTQMVLKSVDNFLILLDVCEIIFVIAVCQHDHGLIKPLFRLADHLDDGVTALGYSDRRCEHESFVELELLLLVRILYDEVRNLDEELAEREQQDCIADIEQCMAQRDTDYVDRIVHEREIKYRI